MAVDVLVIDDEVDIRDLIADILKDEGFAARTAANCTQAFESIEERVPSAVILDIWLQGSELDGLGILEVIKKKYPILPVIVISGHGTIETAVSAIKLGAYDYIEKPFTHEKLMIVLKRAIENARLRKENTELKTKVIERSEIVGHSQIMLKLKSDVEKIAPTSGRVMITGPSGSGKELIARLIHKKSKRSNGPFILFNPTGMTVEKIHQELFNECTENSISLAKRTSVLEAAHNGTLYIDEITDLPLITQTKLLKFLQDQTFEKPGTNKALKLDIRVISSSVRDLEKEVSCGNLREDFFYRLNVIPIKVPSLSERREDISLLSQFFIKQLAKFSGLKERELSGDALATLQAYNWPGNIRQLRNIIEWTLIMNPSNRSSEFITTDMLPQEIISSGGVVMRNIENNMDIMSMPLREAREAFERQYLSAQMSRFSNNISKTSNFVGMERSALHRKLKSLNIHTSYKSHGECEIDEKETT